MLDFKKSFGYIALTAMWNIDKENISVNKKTRQQGILTIQAQEDCELDQAL